jgi:hypothetical protein
MEGGQERDSSPDEQRHIIDDDDMEASPTDSADLWLPERNEEDTMFERALTDAIPTKKRPQSVSEQPDQARILHDRGNTRWYREADQGDDAHSAQESCRS